MSGRVGRTAIVYFASQAIASLAGFLATWFIANQLGSTVLGEYSVIVALLFWLNIPASAIGTSMNKRISETEETGSYIGGGHLLNAAVTLALCIGILLFSNQINSLANGREVSIFVAMLIASQSLFDLSVESLRGIKRAVSQVCLSDWYRCRERWVCVANYRPQSVAFHHSSCRPCSITAVTVRTKQ